MQIAPVLTALTGEHTSNYRLRVLEEQRHTLPQILTKAQAAAQDRLDAAVAAAQATAEEAAESVRAAPGRAAAAAQGEVDRLLSEAFTMPGKAASEAKQSVEQFAAERAREVERKREQLSRLK